MRPAQRYVVWLPIVVPPALLVASALTMAYKEYAARRDVVDYLKLAADAPSLPLAQQYLSTAVRNIESRGWTFGNTALIFRVPRRDLGYWYQNTKGALVELESLIATDSTLTPVDRSNALVKLRETLMDGAHLTFPEWVELAPHNALYFWFVVLSSLGSINSVLVVLRMITQARYRTPIRTPGWFFTVGRWIDRQAMNLGSTRRGRH